MTHDVNKKKIYDALAKLSVLYDNPPSQTRLKAYTELLINYPMQSIGLAIKNAQKTCFSFPSLAWIVKEIESRGQEKDIALQMSGEIIESISRFGPYQLDEAKKFLGPIAWLAVERSGGWSSLCNVTYEQLATTRAQLRELCASQLRTAKKDQQLINYACEKRTNEKIGTKSLKNLLTTIGGQVNEKL